MMKSELILVVGASGTVGSEVLDLLKSQGYRTRATTSKKVNDSSELVQVNLATGEGVSKAFEGVDRAFFLSPPGYADQHALLSPLIQEAKRRGLKKVVLMTAMGANANDATPFRRAELELEKSGLKYNIIRPNWFTQNFHTFWLQGIQQFSKILLPAGAAKVSFVDARDIGATAFALLTSDKFDGQDFDLTGPDAVDHFHVAAELSRVTEREISYQEISESEFLSSLLTAGVPKDYAEFLVLIMSFLREGYSARTTTSIEDITGRAPRGFDQYANDYKLNFKN